MNPETTLSNIQITGIFQKHGLTAHRINRITTGFTNELHQIDNYILKVCVKEENEPQFQKETFLYKALQGSVAVPKVVAVDTTKNLIGKYYMIYQKIEGEPLASHWHELTNDQRRNMIKQLCQQLKLISAFDRETYADAMHVDSNLNWQKHCLAEIQKWRIVVGKNQLFNQEKLQAVDEFVHHYKYVLKPQHLAVMYWDVHFDNMLIKNLATFVGLIDFESVDIVSIDYVLAVVRRMMQAPQRMLSPEMEPFAKQADYQHLMEQYKEFYPELFNFSDLERRLDLYDIADILRLRVYFPNTGEDRLDTILENTN